MSNNPADLLKYSGENRFPQMHDVSIKESWRACLMMVAHYYGADFYPEDVKARSSAEGDDPDLQSLSEFSQFLNLVSQPTTVDFDTLSNLQMPCVAKLLGGHYVIVTEIKKNLVRLHDPVNGEVNMSRREFCDIFTKEIIEVSPGSEFSAKKKTKAPRLKLSSFWSNIKGFKRILTQIVAMSLFIQLFVVAAPLYSQNVIDNVLPRGDSDLLLLLSGGFIFLIVFEMLVMGLRNVSLMHLSTKLNIQMCSNLFSHLVRLPMNYFQSRHMGDLVSRFGSLETVKEVLTVGLLFIFVDSAMMITALVMMFLYSVELTFLVLGISFLYFMVKMIVYVPIRRLTKKSLEAHADSSTSFIETMRAIQGIKVFQKEGARHGLWLNKYAKAMNLDIGIRRWQILEEVLQGLLFGIENILVIYFIATQVMNDTLSIGMFFAFMSYKLMFVEKIQSLITEGMHFRLLGAHLERLADIVFTKKENTEQHLFTMASAPEVKGEIECRNVTFRYEGSNEYVFKNMSFKVSAGESVALVGPSGLGKSTLMKVMMGLLHPESGQVLVDGIDIQEHPKYRPSISSVLQDDALIFGSMANNISFFDENEDIERVKQCAKLACIHNDIDNMLDGYETYIGDMGGSLSGGQQQRVLFARALYRQPKVLFLDEATSNLDMNTENVVNENINNLNMTRVIVAHRKDTIESVDRIINIAEHSDAKKGVLDIPTETEETTA